MELIKPVQDFPYFGLVSSCSPRKKDAAMPLRQPNMLTPASRQDHADNSALRCDGDLSPIAHGAEGCDAPPDCIVATSGALPENVNYAVKSSFLLSFLESVPEVAAKLKEPGTKDRKFEDVVKSAEQAAVLVLVY